MSVSKPRSPSTSRPVNEPHPQSTSGYRDLMTRTTLLWGLVALAGKAPVAMAPLALVFLCRQSPHGYALGASLASAYVVGEVAGASLLGARLRHGRMRRQLSAGLVAGALAFCALPVARSAPSPVLIALAVLAGAAPAACPGGVRAMVTRTVPDGAVPRILSAEATLTQITWAAAPALVVVLALRLHPGAPLLLGGLLAAGAAILLLRLPEPREPEEPREESGAASAESASGESASGERAAVPMRRSLLHGWPVYLTSAASMAMLATAELVLPALLEERRLAVGWSGPLLAGFALAGAAGALCYGLRTWPGSVRIQSLVFLVATAGCLCLVAVLPGVPGIAVGLLLAGVFQSGVMITRTLGLRERLPQRVHAAAYSVMYAVGGAGYSLTASLSAVALDLATPSVAILGGVALTLLITAVGAVAEGRSARRARTPERERRRNSPQHNGR
ncbi:putative MFS family arabinose efflux permease [Streptomyces sp. Amel2xB2]|nr:putative MFS family arabinose efflux permease [Streptomyces sp. Amel2xB2]